MNALSAIVTGSVTVNQALANALGSAIKSIWTSNVGPLCAATTFARVGVRDLRQPAQTEFLDTGAVATSTGTGDPLPSHIAFCVTLRTALAGKSNTGRVYMSGWSEAENDANGVALSAVGAAAVAFITGIDTNLKSNGMALGVMSRPAFRQTLVRTTFYADGSTETDTLSDSSAKSGIVHQVSTIQSRDLRWETQRRRSNSRTVVPTLLVPEHTRDLTATPE